MDIPIFRHPKYEVMVRDAIVTLKEREGSSRKAIKEYILNTYKLPDNATTKNRLKLAITRGVEKGTFFFPNGTSGTIKLIENEPVIKIEKFKEAEIVKSEPVIMIEKLEESEIVKHEPVIKIEKPEKAEIVKIEPVIMIEKLEESEIVKHEPFIKIEKSEEAEVVKSEPVIKMEVEKKENSKEAKIVKSGPAQHFHPKYEDMVRNAIVTLKRRKGCSRNEIKKYILNTYKLPNNATTTNRIKLAITRGVQKGVFVYGSSGTIKLK
ncbi:linker histone H1 and H5 family-domain-containing protein [Glomus cerebriforme]|uniref:Histone H1 n=1 Tax=Glomus cerebriforme TaxID=658196 RepID=A0A397SNU5_9GLOM|nr:linker histone H1 and H5 family-domain-containing protein [Glomus cerebriforme]